jgi:hypothetical protein
MDNETYNPKTPQAVQRQLESLLDLMAQPQLKSLQTVTAMLAKGSPQVLDGPQGTFVIPAGSKSQDEAVRIPSDMVDSIRHLSARVGETFHTLYSALDDEQRAKLARVVDQRVRRAKVSKSVVRKNWYNEYQKKGIAS